MPHLSSFLPTLVLLPGLFFAATFCQAAQPAKPTTASTAPIPRNLPFWDWAGTAPAKAAAMDATIEKVAAQGPFKNTWDSLKRYQVPDWFLESRFGVFIHWGPQTLEFAGKADATDGGKTDWKSRGIAFKGEKFDAAEWVKLFKETGVKYVVQVVEHHDAYAMYDSSFTEWSSVKMAPKRDFARELSAAVRQAGLIYGASSHTEEHWWFYNQPPKKLSSLDQPDKQFLDLWLRRLADIVENYQPQVLWFDWCIRESVYEPYLRKLAAYYYNKGAEWKKGVVLNYKYQAFPAEAAVLDISIGTGNSVAWTPQGPHPRPWQFDSTTSSSWFWKPKIQMRPVADIIGEMADVVSKNGNYLMNFTPAPDGTAGPDPEHVFKEIGRWMAVNGEAIYGTQPWRVFGEGPNPGLNPEFRGLKTPYTSKDIRYVQKGPAVYALVLAKPTEPVRLTALGKAAATAPNPVRKVTLLGSKENLAWTQEPDALVVSLPARMPFDYAAVFKIE